MTTRTNSTPGPRKRANRIEVRPEILAGKPVIKGTRIPVELVLKRLADDLDVDGILEAFPRLSKADIKACIDYAHSAVHGDVYIPQVKAQRQRASRQ